MRLKALRTAILRPVRSLVVVAVATLDRRRKGLTTVDEYLISKGVDDAGRKRWSGAFGRKVAGLFRAAFGVEPRVSWIVWRGRVRRVFVYAADSVHMDTAWGLYAEKIDKG